MIATPEKIQEKITFSGPFLIKFKERFLELKKDRRDDPDVLFKQVCVEFKIFDPNAREQLMDIFMHIRFQEIPKEIAVTPSTTGEWPIPARRPVKNEERESYDRKTLQIPKGDRD